MKRGYKLFAGLALFALLLAGCNFGGGSSNGGSSGGGGAGSNHPAEDSYTITWKNWNGATLETDNNVEKGTLPTYDGATPIRPSDDEYTYTWSGWDPEVVPVTSNQTYTATYSYEKIKTEYVISFDLNGGTSASYNGSKTIESFSKDIFFFDCKKEGWNFRGWSYNGTKIFDEKGNQLANPTMSKSMTFVAMYAQTAKLSIACNIDGAGSVFGDGEYSYNTMVDISAHPYDGYVFVGWYNQSLFLSSEQNYQFMLWNEDINLDAVFKLDSHSFRVYSNNSNYGLVLLKGQTNNQYQEEYIETRDYSSSIMVSASSLGDVRFLGWYNEDNQLVETESIYTFTMPNRDYSLEAKWNYFTVSYELGNGENNQNNPSSYTIESSPIQLRNPTRTGYDFLGWKYKDEFVEEINPSWKSNIILTAVWSAHTYSITYHLNNGSQNSSNPDFYTIESNAITLKSPSRNGYTFSGWYTESTFINKITKISKGSYGDLNLYAKWASISYSITYNLDGGNNNSNNPSTYTIESQIDFLPATKIGYSFAGWFDGNNQQIASINPGRTGALTLTARWNANLNALYVTSEDETKGTVRIASGSGYSDENITVVATPINGSVFKGWYSNSTLVSEKKTYTFKMPKDNYSLVACFYSESEAQNLGIIPVFDNENMTVTYGLYPQTRITSSSLINTLSTLTETEPNGWYLYDGNYYAKRESFYFDISRTFIDGTTIGNRTTYWFKCDPIKWNILANNEGEYLLLSSILLDTTEYSDFNRNNYGSSTVRTWLNGSFYNSAFSLNDEYIQVTEVDNSASTTNDNPNQYECANTNDKVFLLSFKDYLNSNYGFTTNIASTKTRRCEVTDYGLIWGSDYKNIEGSYTGTYWTRSPDGFAGKRAYVVTSDGYVQVSECSSSYSHKSVRPAITLKIS